MDKDERLEKLADRMAAFQASEILVSEAALEARLAGATWEEIGARMGMSKQGAFARFSPMLPYAFPSPD